MSIVKINNENLINIAPLFADTEETMVFSCLQGVMGQAYADNAQNPTCAKIVIADFCFFAGKPNEELVKHRPEEYKSDFIIFISLSDDWHPLFEKVYKNNFNRHTRYALKKKEDNFSIEKLENFTKSLDNNKYKIAKIDEKHYKNILKENWSCSLCSSFESFEDFDELGFGYVILKDIEIICGASSYSVYNEGIEIEIDTKEEYRSQGLATVCGAKLMLECFKQNKYPSWDAQNEISLNLAKKLGYVFSHKYLSYEIFNF